MATAPDYNSIYNQQLGVAQQAIQPQVQTLGAGSANLANQYNSLISQLQGQKQNDIGAQQTTTSREFGARGIPLSSGVFGQTLDTQLGSINRGYAGEFNSAASNYQNSLQNIAQQIAALQGGAYTNAANLASNLYNTQYGGYQNELNRANALQAAQISAGPSYAQVALQRQQYDALQKLLNGGGGNAGVNSVLGGVSKDLYIDKNEYSAALNKLIQSGNDPNSAAQMLNLALQQGGYQKYGNY